jgi:hypothetical protein
MRILQARFYPARRANGDFVVVGCLIWNQQRPCGRPLVRPATTGDARLLSKLLHLLNFTNHNSFAQLLSLSSEFWSFVEVSEQVAFASTLEAIGSS